MTLFYVFKVLSKNFSCSPLINDLLTAIKHCDSDDSIGAMVLTGSKKAFAAGADIKEMQNRTFAENYRQNFLDFWGDVGKAKKPIIAAVDGYALGNYVRTIDISCQSKRILLKV